jgi:hypothetical protein
MNPADGLPVTSENKAWIDRRMAWLSTEFGSQQMRRAPVVLPTAEFFPEPYSGNEADVRRILERVCGWMGIAPESVELALYQDDQPTREAGLQPSTSGLYQDEGGVYRIWIEVKNLADPVALVATCAHELAHVLLLGHGRISRDADDHEQLADLLPVCCGLGVFSANAVIREHNWHVGEWSGWSVRRSGYLTMPMYGYALALFAWARGEDRPAWAKHLRLDVRAAFKQSLRYLTQHGGAPFAIAPGRADGGWPPKAERTTEDSEVLQADDAAGADTAVCKFCGTPLDTPTADAGSSSTAAADDEICAECRLSIEENQRDLAIERQLQEARSERRHKIWRWGCLTVVLFIAAAASLNWLVSSHPG